MIEIIKDEDLPRARAVGALVGGILQAMRERASVGTNLLEIDAWTKEMVLDAGAVSCYVDYAPSFGNGPFGHYICTAVNDAVLHGKPHDYVLADGDLLTLDLAVSLDGVVAEDPDTADYVTRLEEAYDRADEMVLGSSTDLVVQVENFLREQ